MSLRAGPQQRLLHPPDAVPYIAAAGELKTKPTQHSVKELREIGIQPDVAALPRRPADPRRRARARSRCSPTSPNEAVISAWDVDSIYKIPRMLHEQGLDEIVCHKLQHHRASRPTCRAGTSWSTRSSIPSTRSTSRMVGKYVDLTDSYKSLNEALMPRRHPHAHAQVKIHYVDSETIEQRRRRAARQAWTRSWCPAASASAASKARSRAIRYARENRVPYLGICLGMQLAAIEFARNVAGLDGANSTEFDPDTPHPVIALITEWQDRDGSIERRDAKSDLGGTMRLGAQKCAGRSRARWRTDLRQRRVTERHRHRYEVNNNYLPRLEAAGLQVIGAHADART